MRIKLSAGTRRDRDRRRIDADLGWSLAEAVAKIGKEGARHGQDSGFRSYTITSADIFVIKRRRASEVGSMGWTSKPVRTIEIPEPVAEPLTAPPDSEPQRIEDPQEVPAGTP
jgi:hypothetical protein